MPSVLQTVPTVVVQDYEYGTDGRPLANVEVTVRLAVAQGIVGAGVTGGAPVNIEPIEARVKTDSNGFWSVPNIVRNSDITPGGTYYTVKVGLIRQYQIQVPAGAGPFTASAILVGALPFFPSGSSVAGPITITGNLTVTGTGNFSGALTAAAGLSVVGGGNVSGGWTVAGLLTMSDTASRLVPGATSFSIRDNGNLNDNLLVSNAGNVTVRGTLTPTGDLLPAARIVMGPAAGKIVGGATSLSLRNNADNADNVLVTDAGNVSVRGTVTPVTNAYKAKARNTSSTSVGTSITKIALQSKDYDPNGNFDAVTNFTYTVPLAGYYMVIGKVLFFSVGDGVECLAFFFRNGAFLDKGDITPGAIASPMVYLAGVYQFALNDTIDLRAQVGSATAPTWSDSNNFSVLTIHYMSS